MDMRLETRPIVLDENGMKVKEEETNVQSKVRYYHRASLLATRRSFPAAGKDRQIEQQVSYHR